MNLFRFLIVFTLTGSTTGSGAGLVASSICWLTVDLIKPKET